MTMYTYDFSKSISQILNVDFIENPSLSDQELSKNTQIFHENYRTYGGGAAGSKNGHYGCKHTIETRKKLSMMAMGRPAYNKEIPNPRQKERWLHNNPMKNPEIAKKVSEKKKGKPSKNKITKTYTWICSWCKKENESFDTYKNRKKHFCDKSCAASYSNTHRQSSHCPATQAKV